MSTVMQSVSPMDNTVVINEEAVKPILNRHFDQISEAQWSLLADGICDPGVATILTNMICEIIQTLSASAFSIALPMFEERLRRNDSQADITLALENLTTQMENSLSGTFAQVLHISPEKCESAEKLTELIEGEVLQKVTSAVSLAINSPTWQEGSAIFVPGSMSSTPSLSQMVNHASICLKSYMRKLKSSCLCCWWANRPESTTPTPEPEICASSPSKKSKTSAPSVILESSPSKKSKTSSLEVECESSQSAKSQNLEISVPSETYQSPQSMRSRVSVISVTQAVAEILDKWSAEAPDLTEEADSALQPPSPSLEACDAAFEIVSIISNNLHYVDGGDDGCNEKSSSSKHHFSLKLILKNVKDFFTSRAACSEDAASDNQKGRKQRFFKFARKQFKEMTTELETSLQKEDLDFIVPLSQSSGSSQSTLKREDGSAELEAVPESPRPKSEACIQPSRTPSVDVTQKLSSLQEASWIKSAFEKLFSILSLPKKSGPYAKKNLTKLARQLSTDLTDELYGDAMASGTGQLPLKQLSGSLSDPVIISLGERANSTRCGPSLQSKQAKIWDSVGKFFQQMCLWAEKEQSHQTSHSEKVSGALSDIEDLIQKVLTPTEEKNVSAPEALEASDSETSAPYCSTPVLPFNDLCDDDDGELKVTLEETNFRVDSVDMSLNVTPEDRRLFSPRPVSQLNDVTSSDKSGGGLESSDTSSCISERTANCIITALFMRLIMTAPRKTRRFTKTADIDKIIQRLSEVARGNIDISDSDVRKTRDNLTKITKAVIRDLTREFGSSERLLEASMATNSSSFDEAVIRYLKIHLDELYRPKRSAFARFFLRLGKALTKPFRCCTTVED